MKKTTTLQIFALALLSMAAAVPTVYSQNIFSGEPVQVVGQFNSYTTTPYNSDYRTTAYRRVSVSSGTPTDGRGQWATTITIPGGDASAVNMTGGGGTGFLFISGPSGNRFQNKWAFSGVGQGTVDGINNFSAFNSGNDMGLNMNTTGHYTFVFNDAGYTLTNAKYYVGYTSAAPVSINSVSGTANIGGTATINVTTSSSPSSGENVFVRYTTGIDFNGGGSSSLVQVSMTGSSGTATIPSFSVGQTVRYYVFSSTRTLAQLDTDSEMDKSIATLRYNDNGGANYLYVALPVELIAFTAVPKEKTVQLSWSTATERNNSHFDIQRSADSRTWVNIGSVAGKGNSTETQVYQFTDDKPLSGLNFYRLLQVDFDGGQEVSNILQVKMERASLAFSVFPNPVLSDVVQIEFPEMDAAAHVRLFDLQGRLLREWSFEVEGSSLFPLDLSGIPTGNLLVQVNGMDCIVLIR